MGLILVVSEDLVEIEAIRAALSVHGWWVTVAADRKTALQVAADQAPKLVVVDNDLGSSLEMVRSFATDNGGPGVVSLVPQGFDEALELKEAGVDEILTKPLSPPAVVEAVQRCLAAPRPSPAEPRAPSRRLLTREEIFGDVLRELGETGAPPPPPQPVQPAREVQPRVPPTVEATGEASPSLEPSVSLAGLFDDPELAALPTPGTPPAAPRPSVWQGEERRGADRPWSTSRPRVASVEAAVAPEPTSAPREDADTVVCDDADTVVCEDAATVVRDEQSASAEAAVAADTETVAEIVDAPVLGDILASLSEDASQAAGPEPEVPEEALEMDDEVPDAEVEAEARPRRWAGRAVALGSLAATLLVAAGVYLYLGSRSERPEAAAPPAEPSAVVEPAEPPTVVADPDRSEPESSEVLAAAPPVATESAAETAELDLGAIVDEELERREEELRRVFLEEEKRLLRELNKIDRTEPPGDAGGDDDSGDRSGVGR